MTVVVGALKCICMGADIVYQFPIILDILGRMGLRRMDRFYLFIYLFTLHDLQSRFDLE